MKISSKTPSPKRLLIPRPIKAGEAVGIVAASSPPKQELLLRGLRFLEETGFKVREGSHLAERNAYLAGDDNQRCQDLNAMLRDPTVRAIFFARGGYGVMRLLDSIDHEAIIADPKMLIGMSDITALQLSIYTRCGLVTVSGPMVAGQVGEGLDRVSENSLKQALTESFTGRNLLPSRNRTIRIVRAGKASGALIGGCLSLVTSLLGTRHYPKFGDAILFLEDIHEPPYRIDRMFTQLNLAGVLTKVSGFILGHFIGPDGEDLSLEAEGILLNLIGRRPIPVISGFPHGHTLPNLTLPHGVPVRLDTEDRTIVVLAGNKSAS